MADCNYEPAVNCTVRDVWPLGAAARTGERAANRKVTRWRRGLARSGPKWFENNSRNLFANRTQRNAKPNEREERESGWSCQGAWVSGNEVTAGRSGRLANDGADANDRAHSNGQRGRAKKAQHMRTFYMPSMPQRLWGTHLELGAALWRPPWKPATIRQKPGDATRRRGLKGFNCMSLSERQGSFGAWAVAAAVALSGFIIFKLKCLSPNSTYCSSLFMSFVCAVGSVMVTAVGLGHASLWGGLRIRVLFAFGHRLATNVHVHIFNWLNMRQKPHSTQNGKMGNENEIISRICVDRATAPQMSTELVPWITEFV